MQNDIEYLLTEIEVQKEYALLNEGIKSWFKEKLGEKLELFQKTYAKFKDKIDLENLINMLKNGWNDITAPAKEFMNNFMSVVNKFKPILDPFKKDDKEAVAKALAQLIMKEADGINKFLALESYTINDSANFLYNTQMFKSIDRKISKNLVNESVRMYNNNKMLNEGLTPTSITVLISHVLKIAKVVANDDWDAKLDKFNPEHWIDEAFVHLVIENVNALRKQNGNNEKLDHDTENKIEHIVSFTLNVMFFILSLIFVFGLLPPNAHTVVYLAVELLVTGLSAPSLLADFGMVLDAFGCTKYKTLIKFAKAHSHETKGYKQKAGHKKQKQ